MYGIVHNVPSYLLTYSHQQQLTSRPVQKLEQRHTILLYQKHQDSLSFPILSSCQLILLPSHHLLLLQRPREKAEEDSKAFTIKSTFLRPSIWAVARLMAATSGGLCWCQANPLNNKMSVTTGCDKLHVVQSQQDLSKFSIAEKGRPCEFSKGHSGFFSDALIRFDSV